MKRADTYFDENTETYFVSYDGWLYGDEQDEEYSVIYSTKFSIGKFGEIEKYASDDNLDTIIKDLKKEYHDLKKQ